MLLPTMPAPMTTACAEEGRPFVFTRRSGPAAWLPRTRRRAAASRLPRDRRRRREARGRALEHGAHVCETREVLDLDGRHEHAAARIDLDEAFLREAAQRFSCRRAADPELLHQRTLVDDGSRAKLQ